MDETFAALRQRALRARNWSTIGAEDEPLAKALREIDVYHTELELQNEELRETQSSLSVARDRYRALFDEAPMPFVSVSRAGLVLDVNKAGLALLGRPASKVLSRIFALCFAGDSQKDCLRALDLALRHGVSAPVELQLRGERSAAETATEGIWIELRCVPVGELPARTSLCYLTNVTRQRATERRNAVLEHRLREAEKLEAVGRVSANIAHDVNNILVSVISLADFARAAVPEDDLVRRDLDSLLDAAWRGARLMRGLLGLSRPTPRARRPVNVSALMAQVGILQRAKKPGVNVSCELGAGPLWVEGDEDELLHAFLNVASNGLDAMTSGTLRLELRAGTEPGTLEVSIADEGEGMTPEVRERAFEPLFTTKSAKGGSGLGLTIVHKTISAHGGSIDLTSVPGVGTKVTITLPRLEGGSSDEQDHRAPEQTGLAMTVLLVDDNDGVREATRRMLEARGLRAEAFADGASALVAVEQGLAFDVALLDVSMPDLTGPEVADRLLSLLGPCPIVFVTGASAEIIPPHLVGWPHLAVLPKPWTIRELEETLRRVWESRVYRG